MNRRRFAFGLGAMLGGLALPSLAQQAGRVYRVGALFGGGQEPMRLYRAALAERLATHGFVLGRNLQIDERAGNTGGFEREFIRELLAQNPDALFTCLTSGTRLAKEIASGVPIVFTWVADPVAAGLVKDYARPDGNITGVTSRFGELLVKRLELALELVPEVRRVAVTGTASPLYPLLAAPLRAAAQKVRIELVEVPVGPTWDWGQSVAQAQAAEAGAAIPFNQFTASGVRVSGELLVAASLKHRLPVIFAGSEMVEAGGLISYGTSLVNDLRRAADLLARVLRGAKPAEIPVDQAAEFELAVNLKTAREMGIEVPPSILLRADRVIE